ncbi:recombinase family protein [Rhodococcus qingshengii]|uniref:recombinase family protein n=1 Tax=Rhodococcus qingshengii TaxID=334542 RepID=UPI001E590548|nr:recombinase family protein [Rhodococcus qingshengii]MCD2135920.1 recombinase family protein [Rhodococcus qingshengii]
MDTLIGYAWTTPAQPQHLAIQYEALHALGCETITTEVSTTERVQLTATIGDLAAGTALMVWSLDRLARSLPQLVTTIDKILCTGAGLRAISEGIDTTDPDTGTETRRMLAAICTCQHDLHLERTLLGLHAARERGRRGGRPAALTDTTIAQARTMKSAGAATSKIAEALGVSRSTVYRYLNSPDGSRRAR